MKKRIIARFLTVCTLFSLFVQLGAAYSSPKEGTYCFETKLKSGMVLDVDDNGTSNKTNVQIYKKNQTTGQQFKIVSVGSGWYKIVHLRSGKVVESQGSGVKSGTNVGIYTDNGTNNQRWQFISAGSGYYYIKNKTGYYLDVSGGESANRTNVQVYKGNKTNAQKWKLIPSYSVSNNVVTVMGVKLNEYKVGATYPSSSYTITINGKKVYLAATQCFGFARYVQYKLYGHTDVTASKFTDVSGGGVAAGKLTEKQIKEWVTKAGIGAHIRTRGKNHSMVVVGITETGFTIMDANGTAGTNKVGLKTYTWKSYVKSGFGSRGIQYIKGKK